MYFRSIQLLRGFAAVYVTLFHLIYWWNQKNDFLTGIFNNGYGAIDLFFVISGFVVFQSAEKFKEGFRSFFYFLAKRAARIYPMYWIVSLLFLSIGFVHIPGYNVLEFCKTFLLLPGYTAIIIITWTLQYELYFYLLLGLSILNKRLRWILLGLFLLSVTSFLAGFLKGINIFIPPSGFYNEFVLEFLLGVSAVYVFKKPSFFLSVILSIAGLALFLLPLKQYSSHIISFGIPSLFLVIGLTSLEYKNKIRIPLFAVRVGDASYCLYLIHLPIIAYIFPYPASSQPFNRLLIVTFVILITLIAILLHLYVEKPLLTYINKRLLNMTPVNPKKKI
jgi:exopolysaccharide production protein ExoZ